ncbi:hypothetical protein ES703_94546 [subsurface metagenome]
MRAQDGNVISGIADVMVDQQVFAVLLDKIFDLIDERLAWCDVSANAAYICFENAEGDFH